MAVWPSSLQQLLNEDGFSYGIGPTVIRSDMDIGPAKQRRRFTKPVDTISCTIDLSTSEFTIFYDFYDITVNGGVTAFDFTHPVTAATIQVRFINPPVIASRGGGRYRVSMAWEILP